MRDADKLNIDGAKAAARTVLAEIRQLADPEKGRAAYATQAYLTVTAPPYDPIPADSFIAAVEPADILMAAVEPADILIEAAKQGDPLAKKAVHEAIMLYVTHGDPVPERLRNYLFELLLRNYGPQKKPGHKNYLRDKSIWHAVKAVCDCGFKPTRNPATADHPSGCSIVRDVLAEFGVNLSEKTIEEILEKFGKLSRMT
jgi:hypothetical protein